MKEVKVEVIGPEPPCARCQAAKRAAEKAAEKLRQSDISVRVEKVNILSREVVQKYGVLVSPSIAINDVVKIVGRVPNPDEIETAILEEIK